MHVAGESLATQTAPGGEAATKAASEGATAAKQASEYDLSVINPESCDISQLSSACTMKTHCSSSNSSVLQRIVLVHAAGDSPASQKAPGKEAAAQVASSGVTAITKAAGTSFESIVKTAQQRSQICAVYGISSFILS